MIQVRNVPDDLHRALRARAHQEGTTLSELIARELPRIARTMTWEDVFAAIDEAGPVGGPPAADLIRRDRDTR
ncbi:MAG: hypothetical protein AB7G37_02435 [Solirubrobacteraceae bacterium]